ncbi:MAG: hypothetical protein IJ991_08155 [Thermoguttaceae bacterium]|nr:hypothetical protein [Thermoguttaceae bacterium]
MIFSPIFSLRRRARFAVRSSVAVVALFSLALGTTAFAADAATASISPFINKDTLAVVRVNLDNVDFDQLTKTVDGIAATALKNVGYDAASIAKVDAELSKTFAALAQDGQAELAQLRAEFGASEAFLVVQSSKGEGAALLIPIANLKDAQLETLTANVKTAAQARGLAAAVYQKSFLVVASDLKAFGAYYKKFEPSENRKIESFFKENDRALVAAYCGTLRLRPFLDVATEGQTQLLLTAVAPRSVRDALEIFDTTFVDARLTVDAGTLSSRLVFRFNAPVDSGKMLAAIQKIVDDVAQANFKVDDASALEKQFNVVPLRRAIWRGQVRSFLPKQNGAELVADYDLAQEFKKGSGVGPFVVAAAAVAYFTTQNAAGSNAYDAVEIDYEFDEAEAETAEPQTETDATAE